MSAEEASLSQEVATEEEGGAPRKRRRWDTGSAAAAPAPAAPAISPALVSLAPSLGLLANGFSAASAPPAAPVIDEVTAQAAQEAIRRVSSMLKGSSQPQNALDASLSERPFQMDIDINDSSKKGQLTKKQTQEDISKSTGVIILIRGRYKPPGDITTEERPLHLHLQAKTQEALDMAEAAIRDIMGPSTVAPVGTASANPLPPPPPPSTFVPGQPTATAPSPRPIGAGGLPPSSAPPMHTCTIEAGVDPAAGYQVRGKLLGPKGSYLKHIQDQTGVRVQLSGKGSGNLLPDGNEADHPLSLCLNAQTAEQLEVAKQLAEHLIKAVKEDHVRRTAPQGLPSLPTAPSAMPAAPSTLPPAPSSTPPTAPEHPPAAAAYPHYPPAPPYGVVPPGYPPRGPPPYGAYGYPPPHVQFWSPEHGDLLHTFASLLC